MNFTIEPYETENGKIPVNDFIYRLDNDHKAKVRRNLKRLEVNGNMLRMPFSRPLRDGIFELRTQFKDGISRVCYFFYFGRKIILTHGFIKKTEETPEEEIKTAIRYKNDVTIQDEAHLDSFLLRRSPHKKLYCVLRRQVLNSYKMIMKKGTEGNNELA